MPKRGRIGSINAKKAKSKSINIAKKYKKCYIKTDSKLLIYLLLTVQSGEPKKRR